MKQSVQAVIFDFGGVLSYPPQPSQTRRMSAACGLSSEAFLDLFRSLRPEYDRGSWSAEEYWRRLLEQAGTPPADGLIERLQRLDLQSWSRPRRTMVRWAERLRRGGWRTAVLSNMPKELLGPIERRMRWLEDFAPRIYSCQVALIKPEPEIYALCLDRLGLEAGEVVFLDDHLLNVEAARRAGLHAVVFRSPAQCVRELEGRFQLPPLGGIRR